MNLPFDFPEDASELFDLAMKQLKLGDIDGAADIHLRIIGYLVAPSCRKMDGS